MAKVEKTVYTTVEMSDGRVVDFPGKRKIQKESTIHADGTITVRVDFINGETRTLALLPDLIAKYAAHGAEQKLGDEAAGYEDIEDAILAVDDLIGRLDQGEWALKREASGLAGTSVLARALIEVTGKSAQQIREFLSTKTQAQKVALRQDARIAPVVQKLEANKKKKDAPQVDTAELLGELA